MQLRIVSYALVIAATIGSTAHARPRPAESARKHFESNKRFGLGLEFGEPTALTGKYWLGDGASTALDFGIGGLFDHYNYWTDYAGLYVYVDFLWHPVSLASTSAFELPVYIGIGPQFWAWQYQPNTAYSGDFLGVRAPIGISFDFNNVPLDLFVQVVPNVNLSLGQSANPQGRFDPGYFGFLASIGVRYYFS